MRTILLTVVLLFLIPPTTAQAYEQPIAGITPVLSQAEQTPINYAIAYYSAVYDVDSGLVQAVVGKESQGDIQATGYNDNGTTDYGLMQINSCNYGWLETELGIIDFYDPQQNIQCGCYILGLLSSKYDNVHRILMSYNMGETQTRKLWSQQIYSSRYSREVVERLNKIKEVN